MSQPNTVMWRTKPGKIMLVLLDFRLFEHKIFNPLNLISWRRVSCVRDGNVYRQFSYHFVTLFVEFKLFNPLNAELNPICYVLALLGARHFIHVSRIRAKSLTLRKLMSYIYIYIYIYIWSTYS